MDFIYDESGRPFALVYTNSAATPATATYYYVLNLQGDVVGLIDESGARVAEYTYNAWGEILSITNANGVAITSSTHIATLNPLRYRGYYYDSETGFYYLQSRYYDPVTHRFINADSLASTGQGILGTNMFAYCRNKPVDRVDALGTTDEEAEENKDGNVENMMAFYGVSSPEDLPQLEDGCMVFIENISSVSIGCITIVSGKTIVMDRDKYCEYSFVGIAMGVSGIPYDYCVTAGEVYGVNDPSDYAGLFLGASTNFIVDGNGGAVAPNGVRAKILGTYGYMSASVGGSVTYYFEASETWTYGKAPLAWHPNNYSSFFDWREDGERFV